ncbi:MAG: hypothetical protein C4341_03805 [Armatimonadota bacterium]
MSVGLPFQTGQSLQVTMAGAEDIDAFDVQVAEITDGVVVLLGGDDAAHLWPGTDVMVRHPGDDESVCWGKLEKILRNEGGMHLHVHGLRCERMDQRRAPRKPANLAVVVSHVVVEDDGSKETRRSLGRVVNVSRTGVRIRCRAPLTRGTLVHLQIDFGTTEPTVAIGQVVRVVAGSEFGGGGFEVGISFARVLQGVEQLYVFLGDVKSASDSAEEAEENAEPEVVEAAPKVKDEHGEELDASDDTAA